MIVKASTNVINIATASLIVMDFDDMVSREAFGLAIANLIFVIVTIATMIVKNAIHRNIRSLAVMLLLCYNLVFDSIIIHNHLNGIPINKHLHNMAIFIIAFNSVEFLSINI